MKKVLLCSLMLLLLLPGCSLLQEVNQSLNYGIQATDLIQDANQFAEQLPELAEQAIANPEMIDALKQELEAMKERIVSFQELVPPGIAEGLHEQFLLYIEPMKQEIDQYLQQINDKGINLEALKDAPILNTIQNMARLLQNIEQLGQ
jgi:septation ring formation regulator EzrA